MNKKAAVEMIETIMVLVVVIILIMLGIVFYFRSTQASIEETGKEVCMLSGNDLLAAVTAMPEIQCSTDTVSKDCIDIEKALAFKELLKDKNTKDHYDDVFSGTCPKKITIELVYPEPEEDKECQAGQQTGKCSTWTVYTPPKTAATGKQLISTPVSIHSLGKNYIGRLTVEVQK